MASFEVMGAIVQSLEPSMTKRLVGWVARFIGIEQPPKFVCM
jgi:hypothetical protein